MTADEEFRRRDETAMAGKLSALGAHEHERLLARLLWTETPRKLNHLHAFVAVPYDDAALVEWGVRVERDRLHR